MNVLTGKIVTIEINLTTLEKFIDVLEVINCSTT